MKKCSKCKIERKLSAFSKDKSCKDGLCCQCKNCRRKYRQSEAGIKSQHRFSQKYKSKNPEKTKAINIVNNAVRDGKLTRPSVCESCPYEGFIEAHHEDYNKPLDVSWLCRKCHIKIHRKDMVCGIYDEPMCTEMPKYCNKWPCPDNEESKLEPDENGFMYCIKCGRSYGKK